MSTSYQKSSNPLEASFSLGMRFYLAWMCEAAAQALSAWILINHMQTGDFDVQSNFPIKLLA